MGQQSEDRGSVNPRCSRESSGIVAVLCFGYRCPPASARTIDAYRLRPIDNMREVVAGVSWTVDVAYSPIFHFGISLEVAREVVLFARAHKGHGVCPVAKSYM